MVFFFLLKEECKKKSNKNIKKRGEKYIDIYDNKACFQGYGTKIVKIIYLLNSEKIDSLSLPY